MSRQADASLDFDSILNALPSVVVVVNGGTRVLYVNNAGEQFFGASAKALIGRRLDRLVPADSPLFALIAQARDGNLSVSEYHVSLASPRIGHHVVNVSAAPVPEVPDAVVVSMQERSVAAKIDRQLTNRGVARSVSAMAAMLAHEVKNRSRASAAPRNCWKRRRGRRIAR